MVDEMEDEIVVKNTLAFQFPGNAPQPTIEDMGHFVKTLKGDRKMMDTAYKISDEKSVFIRFKSEDAMNFVLANNNIALPFHYVKSGKKVTVRMSVAGGHVRYVRIFDLVPEVSERDLSSVFEKYGTIRRMVRERFPADSDLQMFSGIRGIFMDIKKEIPETLFFRGRKGRIYYEGVTQLCYYCRSPDHLKRDCPQLQAKRDEEADKPQGGKHPAQTTEIEPVNSLVEETGGGAAAAGTASEASNKQKKKQQKFAKGAGDKRQLSFDSDTTTQPQEKKKTGMDSDTGDDDDDDDDDGGSMITVDEPEQGQTRVSESESDLEIPDENASTEDIEYYIERRNRKDRRHIAKLVSRHK